MPCQYVSSHFMPRGQKSCLLYINIFIFCVDVSKDFFFAHSPIKYEQSKQI